jgi:hypothetical protein
MKRAAVEKARTSNVWRRHYNHHLRQNAQSGGQRPIACSCDLEVNRFRKGQKVFGCGRPRCYACHGEKLLGIPRHRDLRRALIGSD